MTTQEIFNRVARHLLTQGARAANPVTGACLYRAPDGKKCAVGCLIPDDKYRADFEGCLMGPGIFEAAVGAPSHERRRDFNLLLDLQAVHDGKMPCNWRFYLEDVSRTYLLNSCVLDEFADLPADLAIQRKV